MALNEQQAEQIRKQLLEQLSKFPAEQVSLLKQQIENATPEQLEKFISSQEGSEDAKCLFCEIAAGRVETIKIFEDPAIFVMLDISPANPGHLIIIPKEHYQFIFQVPDQVLWDMMRIAKLIIPSLINIVKAKGFNLLISQGIAAGQRVEHLSLNIIPRFEKDSISFDWERKQLMQEQNEIAAKLREIFSKVKQESEKKVELNPEKPAKKENEEKQEEKAEKSIFFPTRMP